MNPMAQAVWRLSPRHALSLDRPRVLGIVNVTPDSFSDGGEHASVEAALRGAERMLDEGADGLDVGAESTRPGAVRVSAAEQIARAAPVVSALRRSLGDGFAITIDTTLCEAASAALDAGADAVNDVSAGVEDAGMLGLCAARKCGIVLMHRLRPPGADVFSHQYAQAPEYAGNVVDAVRGFLAERAEAAVRAGVARDGIVLDPGLGFGKSVEQNLELIARTGEIAGLGYPVMSGISRKSFTAAAAGMDPAKTPPRERGHATVGLSVMHWIRGARIFRVHDVREHVEALRAAARATADNEQHAAHSRNPGRSGG